MVLKKWLIIILMLGMIFAWFGVLGLTSSKDSYLKETMFYKKLENNIVQCGICFRRCIIAEDKRGFCRNRENKKGILYNIVYAKPSAVQIDPIEKEPQFHFLPGSKILCLGTAGCNFRCKHCHNWHLSQRALEQMDYVYDLPAQEVIKIAKEKNIPTISFTYNEPTSFYEYVYDIARLAKANELRVIWHSNGSLNKEPLEELLKYTDAVTIDLKGFTEKFYSEVSSAELRPVLDTLKIIKEKGIWLEIVNLIIPGLNDAPEDLRRMCGWIKENLGPDVPLHFTRFSPAYKLLAMIQTPPETLEMAYRIAKEAGLNYVTIGNLPGHTYNSTFCPRCKRRLIHRVHFTVLENNIVEGRCRFCGQDIPGVWR